MWIISVLIQAVRFPKIFFTFSLILTLKEFLKNIFTFLTISFKMYNAPYKQQEFLCPQLKKKTFSPFPLCVFLVSTLIEQDFFMLYYYCIWGTH